MNISIQRSRGSHLLFVLPALLLALLVHFRGVSTFFAQDDITFLSRAAGLEPRVGFFRPVSADLWFRAQFACFGLDPTGYHVLSLVLHLLNVIGVYALALGLRLSRATAGAAAVLFGVASLAFTPLHWSTGAMELLACLFLVGATCLQIAVRDRGWKAHSAAAGIALLAMLSKETAVGWIIVVALSP